MFDKGPHRRAHEERGVRVEFEAQRNSDLHTARAWSIVEMFSRFWAYFSPTWARKLFDRWYAWAIRSRLEPIKNVARMLKAHLPNLLTYLRRRITNAATEAINSKIQWIKAPPGPSLPASSTPLPSTSLTRH